MGGGLYLQVTDSLTKSWFFRYSIKGRTITREGKKTSREMGLGPYPVVTLAMAREKALDLRRAILNGVDPLQAKREARVNEITQASRSRTFDDCIADFISSRKAGWDHPKSATNWEYSLRAYCSPVVGKLPLSAINLEHVTQILDPIWNTKTETAKKVRGRLEQMLAWAAVKNYRDKANPAAWKHNLSHVYASPNKIRKPENFASEPYAKVPAFFAKLKDQEGIAACALELIILTAVRTGAAIGARWEEFDLSEAKWTVPAARMKAPTKADREEFEVPLSKPALKLLRDLEKDSSSALVFPTPGKPDQPISNNACLALLERMGRGDITVHGFRSSFRTWAGEETKYDRDVVEFAMGHKVVGAVEGAYYRATMFRKRIPLMEAWARFCTTPTPEGQVISMSRKRKKEAVGT